MDCNYFNKCGSCSLPLDYQEQLKIKKKHYLSNFSDLDFPKPEVFESNKSNFRNRAEFRIYRINDGECLYAMSDLDKKVFPIEACPIVNQKIYDLMAKLIDKINSNDELKRRLFSIEFLATDFDKVLVTLIYHRPIDENWKEEALKLQEELEILIIGRSRKIKEVCERDSIKDTTTVLGREYNFNYFENGFTQPNGKINEKMISWAKENSQSQGEDLLELYCGMGNFTIPLSENFDKVLATEISKTSIRSAKSNCEENDISNIQFLRMSSEEFNEAWEGKREFRRLKEQEIDLKSFNFKTIFVDPPRAGLDEKTREFVKTFDNVIYISCSPESLLRDLTDLSSTHSIEKSALFDQFPYTNHIESGVILKKR
ncbi:MAG: tRNA (uridine(54)-C5)-methyltransferase TrmA [Campylobacterales bacterium]|nr:tRNA (uridine(54)-C5)-methyltransferase TrmA [Campylobacterales bacterium]